MAPPGISKEAADDELKDWDQNIDSVTFNQLLEMDDEDEDTHEFSSGIVFDFLTQAEATFKDMDKNLERKDLKKLSDLGHFLKGSSSTVGFTHIKDACEKIQNLGKGLDEKGEHPEDNHDLLLELIKQCITDAREAYNTVERLMVSYFALLGVERPA